ncbi:hypothetical protein A6J40_01930 [Legionella longbeachae]|uniref:hypothetical protein n=1 Tax=Legionella longbeachae TaxID=450 RepID=UPI0009B73E00|nr:hypothetical protein [Legionella longbeachae]ARB91020.1 hypothetical protein A6J40_01930 [Legionella longbeachae]RZV21188.1 hypothetical protein EKG34_17210 [Legionella longbeachae]UAK45779.1 hypothetical protein K8O86_13430 [Legionella longbeachae]VEE02718.1 Uncharacterised protein [Legionella oakridgensis]
MEKIHKDSFNALYSLFKDEYKWLSPLNGFFWLNNELIEKYYNFGSGCLKYQTILEELFYQNKQVEFDVTSDIKRNGFYLTDHIIGMLMVIIIEARSANKQILDTTLASKIYHVLTNSPDYQNKVNQNTIHHANCIRLGGVILDIYKKVKANITQIESNLLTLEKKVKNETLANNKLIQQAEFCYEKKSELKLIRDNIKAIKLRKQTALKQADSVSKGKLITLLNDSIAQETEALRAKIKESLLSAGLYRIYEERNLNIKNLEYTKEELTKKKQDRIDSFLLILLDECNLQGLDSEFVRDYLPIEKYHRYVEEKVLCFIERNDPQLELLNKGAQELAKAFEYLILDDFQWQKVVNILLGFLWLKVGGTPERVYQYISILKNYSPGVFKHTLSDEKFCSLSHDLFYSEVFGRFFPPLCITTTCTPNSDTTITFSDCGESSLRNFINILIKNNDEFILDSSYLEKTNLNIDARVIKFYKDNNSILDIKKIESHNQWAQIVSKLNTLDPSIKYLSPRNKSYCELAAGGRNMLKVLKILFGTDDVVKICEEISLTSNKRIECDLSQFYPENDNICDYENFIKITINKTYVFYWYFLKQHFRCKTTDLNNEENELKINSLHEIHKWFISKQIDFNSYRNIISFITKEMHIKDVLDLCNNLDIGQNQKLELVFTAKLNSIDSMFDFCMAVLSRDELICESTLIIITRIIDRITDHPVIKEQTRALVQLVKKLQIEPLYPVLERWWTN